jgi:hypothetical protein
MHEQKRFAAYKIKAEDTIQSLSTKLNISLQELRNFHNVFAKQEELISIDLHKGLEFLYIYPTSEIDAFENALWLDEAGSKKFLTMQTEMLSWFKEAKLIKKNYG